MELSTLQAGFGHLQGSDAAFDTVMRQAHVLLERFHGEMPALERAHEATKAIERFRSDNRLYYVQQVLTIPIRPRALTRTSYSCLAHVLLHTLQALSARNEAELTRHGDQFIPNAEEFLMAYRSYECVPVMATFIRELERTVAEFHR
jgi:hypothetical protein